MPCWRWRSCWRRWAGRCWRACSRLEARGCQRAMSNPPRIALSTQQGPRNCLSPIVWTVAGPAVVRPRGAGSGTAWAAHRRRPRRWAGPIQLLSGRPDTWSGREHRRGCRPGCQGLASSEHQPKPWQPGPPHLSTNRTSANPLRTDRPRAPPALAVPRCLRLHTQKTSPSDGQFGVARDRFRRGCESGSQHRCYYTFVAIDP